MVDCDEVKIKLMGTSKGEEKRFIYVFDGAVIVTEAVQKGFLSRGPVTYRWLYDLRLADNAIRPVKFKGKDVGIEFFQRDGSDTNCTFIYKSRKLRDLKIQFFNGIVRKLLPDKTETGHDWILKTFDQSQEPVRCSVCKLLLWGVVSQGYECRKDKTRVHKSCMAKAKPATGGAKRGPTKRIKKPSAESPKNPPVRGAAGKETRRFPKTAPGLPRTNVNTRPPAPAVSMQGVEDYEIAIIAPQDEAEKWRPDDTVISQITRHPIKQGDKIVLIEKIGKILWRAKKTYGTQVFNINQNEAKLAPRSAAPVRPGNKPRPSGPGGPPKDDYVNLPKGGAGGGKDYQNLKPREYINLNNPGGGGTSSTDFHDNWYMGSVSRQESVAQFNEDDETGAFLVRFSTNKGNYILDIRVPGTKDLVRHIPIEKSEQNGKYYVAKKFTFATVPELVNYYQNNSLETAFPHVPTHLTIPNGNKPFEQAVPSRRTTTRRPTGSAARARPVIATCEARFAFDPRNQRDLAMQKGDVIEILEDRDGWCVAQSHRGTGMVPGNFLDPPRSGAGS